MALPENDFETDDKGQDVSDPCVALEAAIREFETPDTFCIFLKTHLCICKRTLAEPGTPALGDLNRRFAARMVDVYTIFKGRKTDDRIADLPKAWIKAFSTYLDGSPRMITLAYMAAAHILEDLGRVVFFVDITKDEYDRVLDVIVDCVTQVEKTEAPGFRYSMYSAIQFFLDRPRKYAVETMRELAWQYSQELKRLRNL